jgi:hypothetical protein
MQTQDPHLKEQKDANAKLDRINEKLDTLNRNTAKKPLPGTVPA